MNAVSETRYIVDVPAAAKTVCVFANVQMHPDFAASIHVCSRGTWTCTAFVSNEKPSVFLRISQTRSDDLAMSVDSLCELVQIGVSVEPMQNVLLQAQSASNAPVQDARLPLAKTRLVECIYWLTQHSIHICSAFHCSTLG